MLNGGRLNIDCIRYKKNTIFRDCVVVLGFTSPSNINESYHCEGLYSKACLKGPLTNDKTKVFKTNDSLMKVKSIAECSLGAFCNTFDLH